MEVVSDVKVLEKEYPCLAAVNRCANCRICFYPQLLLGTVQIIFLFIYSTLNVKWTRVAEPSSSCRCSPPPGQSHQAAVLRRGTHPEDPDARGKGEERRSVSGASEMKCVLGVKLGAECRWNQAASCFLGHHLRHWWSWHQGRRFHGRDAPRQVWSSSCGRLLPGALEWVTTYSNCYGITMFSLC